MIPAFGTIYEAYWEWWLHHSPFRRQVHSCPVCSSDTGCFKGCPAREINNKLSECKELMKRWINRDRSRDD